MWPLYTGTGYSRNRLPKGHAQKLICLVLYFHKLAQRMGAAGAGNPSGGCYLLNQEDGTLVSFTRRVLDTSDNPWASSSEAICPCFEVRTSGTIEDDGAGMYFFVCLFVCLFCCLFV